MGKGNSRPKTVRVHKNVDDGQKLNYSDGKTYYRYKGSQYRVYCDPQDRTKQFIKRAGRFIPITQHETIQANA